MYVGERLANATGIRHVLEHLVQEMEPTPQRWGVGKCVLFGELLLDGGDS